MKENQIIGPHRVALVTGGSSGIGFAVARLLARRGSHVWLVARNPDRISAAVHRLEQDRGSPEQQIHGLPVDVSDAAQVFAAVERIQSEAGPPHLVINSAGQAYPGYVDQIELETFRQLMDVNYFGSVYTTKAVLPKMLERGWGHLVFISSLGGLISAFGYTAYSASKFALHGFSDALRQEIHPRGIKVSIVCPSDTDTPQLAYENGFKPAETRALAANASILTPEYVAEQMLSGISQGRYLIIPGMDAKLFYLLKRLLGGGFDRAMDWIIARARRKCHSSLS
jgi:3-dehydrosphinganine reductase